MKYEYLLLNPGSGNYNPGIIIEDAAVYVNYQASNILKFSEENLQLFPFVKKSIFRSLEKLLELQEEQRRPAFWKAQARFLKAAREWRGLTPSEIQKKSGISPEMLSMVESGEKPVLSAEWMRLTWTFNVQKDADTFEAIAEEALEPVKAKGRDELSREMLARGLYDPLRSNGKKRVVKSSPKILKFSKPPTK